MFGKDLGGLGHCVFGMYRTVGPHLHDQLIVIGPSPDPGILSIVLYLEYRRKIGIDRNRADRLVGYLVLVGELVTAALAHRQLQLQRTASVQCGDMEFGIHHLDTGIDLQILGRQRPGAGLLDAEDAILVPVVADSHFLEVEDDFGHILAHALDGGKLVLDAFDTDLLDGGTLNCR